MLVGDLVYNDNFDCDCNYRIYDCTSEDVHYNNGAKCVHDAVKQGNHKPLDSILDMQVSYITIFKNCLIVEATKRI